MTRDSIIEKLINTKLFDDLQVVNISIVEVLDTNYDIETEEITKYPISEVWELIFQLFIL